MKTAHLKAPKFKKYSARNNNHKKPRSAVFVVSPAKPAQSGPIPVDDSGAMGYLCPLGAPLPVVNEPGRCEKLGSGAAAVPM